MRNNESEEMYLETIWRLRARKPTVRSVDIVEELGYAKSSVSRAVNLLIDKGYVTMDASGDLALTDMGQKRASGVYERHLVLTRLLRSIGADEELAESNACRIEHVISDEMFALIKDYTNKNS